MWTALLRVAVGLVWLFEAFPQVRDRDAFLGEGFTTTVGGMAAGNPWTFYRDFLDRVVLTHASIFSYLALAGMLLVGLCLLLGLLTPYSAVVGILLNINFALAAGWQNRNVYAVNGLLVACEIVLIAYSAGKIAGIDAALAGGGRPRARRY